MVAESLIWPPVGATENYYTSVATSIALFSGRGGGYKRRCSGPLTVTR